MIPRRALLLASLAAPSLAHAQAPDRVRVAVFNVSSALPYRVAAERGFFREAGIEATAVPLQTAPLIVQSMIAGDIEAASNLVTLEGANINVRRPGTALYIALNGQNAQYRMEQFVVRPQHPARSIAELKGARILSAPGPANISAARAVLAANGLQEGRDYTWCWRSASSTGPGDRRLSAALVEAAPPAAARGPGCRARGSRRRPAR